VASLVIWLAVISLSLKSKQFVSIKNVCPKCCSEIEMPGELHMGPGQPEKFEVVLPFINDGVQTPLHGQSGQLNCEKPQLSRIGTFMHLSNHYYITWSLQYSSGAAQPSTTRLHKHPNQLPLHSFKRFSIKPGELHMGPGLYVITILS